MKSREKVVCAVLVALLLFGVYHEFGGAAGGDGKLLPARVGVVSIQKVFIESKTGKAWKLKYDAEREDTIAELKKLNKEIIEKAEILKVRNRESSDYTDLLRELTEKNITFQAKENFYPKYYRDQQARWEEDSFISVLAVIEKTAKAKGIDIVLAKEEYQWPSVSADEFAMVKQTSKLLYHVPELDITDAVIAAWDATK